MVNAVMPCSFSRRRLAAFLATTAAMSSQGVSAFTSVSPMSAARTATLSPTRRGFPSPAWENKRISPRALQAMNSDGDHEDIEIDSTSKPSRSSTPQPALFEAADNLFKDHKAAAAASALLFALTFSPNMADAAMSGGRMGGSFSRSGGSYSRAMPSRSYSGGGGYYRSGPSVTVAPIVTPYASPFYNPFMPRPMLFGGPGAVVYHRGPSFFDLLFLGGIGFFILSTIRSFSAGADVESTSSSFFGSQAIDSPLGVGTSVGKISVALEVPNRDDPNSILSALDRIANTARTDSRVGIQNLTSQVALELLRRKASIISASTRSKHFNDRFRAERDFNSLSVKERGKFEQETVSKFGGVDYAGSGVDKRASSGDGRATVAVVTIVYNIDGDSTKLPKVGSIRDVEEALRKIASDAKIGDCLQGAEILWTPEDRSETLTLRDVVADYPELITV